MNRKHLITIVIGALISGGLLAFALWNVDFKALGAALAHARPQFAAVLLLGALVTLVLRAWRWRLLLPAKDASLGEYFRLVTIGLAVNNVLPLRLGEVARALFAAEKLNLPILTVLASILIERLLDALTIITLFLILSVPHSAMPWVSRMRSGLTPLWAGLVAAFIAAYFIEVILERSKTLDAALRSAPRLHKLVDQLMLGFKPLQTPQIAISILLSGGLLWIVDVSNYYMGGRAIDLGVPLPFSYAIVVLASAGFSTVVPTLPGYIGAFELVVSESLRALGATKESAFGFAVLVHMVAYLFVTALGMWFLYREGTSLMDVWRRAQEKKS